MPNFLVKKNNIYIYLNHILIFIIIMYYFHIQNDLNFVFKSRIFFIHNFNIFFIL